MSLMEPGVWKLSGVPNSQEFRQLKTKLCCRKKNDPTYRTGSTAKSVISRSCLRTATGWRGWHPGGVAVHKAQLKLVHLSSHPGFTMSTSSCHSRKLLPPWNRVTRPAACHVAPQVSSPWFSKYIPKTGWRGSTSDLTFLKPICFLNWQICVIPQVSYLKNQIGCLKTSMMSVGKLKEHERLNWLVVSTFLKYMLVKLEHFPRWK